VITFRKWRGFRAIAIAIALTAVAVALPASLAAAAHTPTAVPRVHARQGEKPTIVFVHGAFADSRTWQHGFQQWLTFSLNPVVTTHRAGPLTRQLNCIGSGSAVVVTVRCRVP
jgi:hypothetical protein